MPCSCGLVNRQHHLPIALDCHQDVILPCRLHVSAVNAASFLNGPSFLIDVDTHHACKDWDRVFSSRRPSYPSASRRKSGVAATWAAPPISQIGGPKLTGAPAIGHGLELRKRCRGSFFALGWTSLVAASGPICACIPSSFHTGSSIVGRILPACSASIEPDKAGRSASVVSS